MDPGVILLFSFLFLSSAFFSASEIALMSIPKHKIDGLLKQNKFGAKSLKYVKERNDKLLIFILVGNNIVNVSIASLATQMAITLAGNTSFEQNLVIGIATLVTSLAIIFFGEIIPKSFASKNAGKIALLIAKPYQVGMIVFTPVLFIIEFITKIFTGKTHIEQITDEEIESFIDMGKDSGVFDSSEHEKIKNMLEFSDITVEGLYTPRVKIEALNIDTDIDHAIEYILENTHSRIPLYRDSIDNIEYVVNLRFLIEEQKKGNGAKKLSELKNLDKAIKIPLNQPIDTLLEIFRKSRRHLAIVLDEYGGVAGLVTLEDIIEEVFGEIRDEYDKEKDEIRCLGEQRFEVDPVVIMEDILEKLELDFENLGLDKKEYYATTLNYFITEELERFPKTGEILEKKLVGEKFEKEGFEVFLVLKMKQVIDNKIEHIEVFIETRENTGNKEELIEN